MPVIAGMSYVTLTGTFLNLQSGGPSVGMVRFSMPFQLVNTTTDEIIVPSDFSATLDANGSFSISLPATDDPDFLPDDRYWRVTEAVDGKNRDYAILLPASPSTQDLADIAPIEPTEPNEVYTLLPDVADLEARVEALEPPLFRPENYGAAGDGVTDDSSAIQDCIDAAAGAPVWFTSRLGYFCGTGLTTGLNAKLFGLGLNMLMALANGPALFFAPAVTIGLDLGVDNTIIGLRVDGGDKAHGNTAIRSVAGSPILRDVTISRWDTCVEATDAFQLKTDCVEFNRCNTGYLLDGCYNVSITNPISTLTPVFADLSTTCVGFNVSGPGSVEGYGTSGGIIVRAGLTHVTVDAVYTETAVAGGRFIVCTAAGAGTGSIISVTNCQAALNEAAAWVDLGTTAAHLKTGGTQFSCAVGSSTTPVAYKVATATGTLDFGVDNTYRLDKGTLNDLTAPSGDAVWVGAAGMELTIGSPSASNVGASNEGLVPVKLMDAASVEGVGGVVMLPASWRTWRATIYWTNGVSSSGNVVWRLTYKAYTDGTSLDGALGALTTAAAPAQYVLEVTELVTGIARGTGPTLVQVWRVGDNVADTLANDAALLGVLVEQVT